LQLPNYQESSRQEKLYHLEGARLVALNNDYAAYVAYKMKQSPITLGDGQFRRHAVRWGRDCFKRIEISL